MPKSKAIREGDAVRVTDDYWEPPPAGYSGWTAGKTVDGMVRITTTVSTWIAAEALEKEV